MGSKDAPESDPRIGEAALMSAQLGGRYLDYMENRNVTTDQWAAEDRGRDKTTFQPLQDQYIAQAKNWATPQRQAQQAAEARGDVVVNFAQQRAERDRRSAAMGISPASGRYAGVDRADSASEALAAAGAENVARDRVRTQGMDLLGNAINLGSGFQVNPLSSYTAGTSAASAGFQGAIGAQGQAGQLYNQQYQNKLNAWNSTQQSQGSLFGGIGGLVGLAFASDKNVKTDRKPAKGLLKAVNEMPVESWRYKPGEGDSGSHVGPMAQDFQKATGHGDGKSIDVITALGTLTGAVQELDKKVERKGRLLGAG